MPKPPSSPWTRALGALALAGAVIGAAITLAVALRRAPAPSRALPAAATATAAGPTAPSALPDPGPAKDSAAPDAPADAGPAIVELDGGTLAERNVALLTNMQRALGLGDEVIERIRAVFAASDRIGQGNPEVSRHPLTRTECLERRKAAKHLAPADPRCQAAHMVPLYDPSRGEGPENARVCIDQFEFPNLPCELPVVWVRANEAQTLCRALDKRLCDAHEWEGGCAGALEPAETEYAFGERRIMMQYLHNQKRERIWAYGKEKDQSRCATGSQKSPRCSAGGFHLCGTNGYPAGSFPDCVSPLGVYDQHGNVAEHMSLPMKPEELGSRGGTGATEMKGSWFIWSRLEAHEDDCRFRAPDWHATRVDDPNSHRNYHLGFRCCRDLP
jgi:sulfatase modifying factor 1